MYVGDAGGDDLKLGQAAPINDTPDPWHGGPQGIVKWTRQAYEADRLDGRANADVTRFLRGHFAVVGSAGLSTVLRSGTDTDYEPEFLVRAKPSQYVAIVVGFGIDDSVDFKGPDVGLENETRALIDADPPEQSKPHPRPAKTKPLARAGAE